MEYTWGHTYVHRERTSEEHNVEKTHMQSKYGDYTGCTLADDILRVYMYGTQEEYNGSI